MKSEPLHGQAPDIPYIASNHATFDEVTAAIEALSEADHQKLMLIAEHFCSRRRLSLSVMGPEDLLSEAFTRTLQMKKKWRKGLSFIKHLDRAMENISGHRVGARQDENLVSFPDGLTPDELTGGVGSVNRRGDETKADEEAKKLLNSIFGDDSEAARVFTLRAEGLQAAEIQTKLRLSAKQYETIARRIRRRMATFLVTLK